MGSIKDYIESQMWFLICLKSGYSEDTAKEIIPKMANLHLTEKKQYSVQMIQCLNLYIDFEMTFKPNSNNLLDG